MNFGVFIHRTDSIYDDRPAERYQFPRQYLSRVEACVGGWIVYYEPRKVVGTRGYFAIAKVQAVIADPARSDMHIAVIETGSYLEFLTPIPFSDEGGLVERGLLNAAGGISGRAQAAVRPLSPGDFDRITGRGLSEEHRMLDRLDPAERPSGFADEQTPFVFEEHREREVFLTSRIVRDRVFRRIVLNAYGERCAVSGLKLINGGGRAEVDAAHIRPVHAGGPDIVGNGLALSGTAHWMFDRGLIGLTDDLEIMVSRHVNDREGVGSFLNRSGRAISAASASQRPHPRFLSWHRDHCFKH